MKKLRILLTGGGTGGHVYPLIAVTQELKAWADQNGVILDARYFGGADEYIQSLVENGIRFVPIASSKLRRYASAQNIFDFPKFLFGILQALWKIFWFMPDVVFSKGGPGALSVVIACKFYMVPLVIHESDSVPGYTNIASGKFAQKIYVAFASAKDYFTNQDRVELVGNPVRQNLIPQRVVISDEQAKIAAKRNLGFDPNAPLLLVLGGSQGATRINSFVLENLLSLMGDFQILHQVGSDNYDAYAQEYNFLAKNWSESEKVRYRFEAHFDKNLPDVYSAADLVLARAGAGTITELALFGKPAILVPLPEAAGDHQLKNAYQYAEAGAAIVIEQKNLLGNLVIGQLKQLIGDQALLQQMAAAAKGFYLPEAARSIAAGILKLVIK